MFVAVWEDNLYKIKENKQGSALVINSAQITFFNMQKNTCNDLRSGGERV